MLQVSYFFALFGQSSPARTPESTLPPLKNPKPFSVEDLRVASKVFSKRVFLKWEHVANHVPCDARVFSQATRRIGVPFFTKRNIHAERMPCIDQLLA